MRSVLGVLHGAGHFLGTEVDGGHQVTQLVDGVIDRVGNRTGEVFRHRHHHRQVAIGQVFNFVEQAHDRLLVALIHLRGFTQLAMGFTDHHQADEDDRRQCQQPQHVATDGIQGAPAGKVLEAVGQA
ncbi:hypothetical protein D9M71_504060 [compost metagenome]